MLHPLFTIDMLRQLHVFSNVLDFIDAVTAIIKTFSTLSEVRIIVSWILLQLDILYTSAVKRDYAKNNNSPLYVFQRIGVRGNKKNSPSSSSDLSHFNFLLWRALQQKLYRQDFQNLVHLKHVLLHNQDAIKGGQTTAKELW